MRYWTPAIDRVRVFRDEIVPHFFDGGGCLVSVPLPQNGGHQVGDNRDRGTVLYSPSHRIWPLAE